MPGVRQPNASVRAQRRRRTTLALQTLEAVAAGSGLGSDTALQCRGEDEGAWLRVGLAGYDGGDRSLVSSAGALLVGPSSAAPGLLAELDAGCSQAWNPADRRTRCRR